MKAWRKILTSPFRAEGTWARVALLIVLIALLVLGHEGFLRDIIAVLDSPAFTLEIEKIRITPYRALKVILVILFFLMLAGTLTRAIAKSLNRAEKLDPSNRELLTKGFQTLSLFVIFLFTLDILDIDLTAFAVLGGAIGIGIGFGLQKIASNFISGLILLLEKSVRIGDLVELSGGARGFVRQVNGRYSLIEAVDGTEIMVPNEDFITGRVTNWTFTNPRARIDVVIGVAYGSDLDLVRQLLLEAAAEHPRCSKEHEPVCFLKDFAASAVEFELNFWIDDVREGRFEPRSTVLFSIWRKFKDKGIEIPYPQADIHLKSGSLGLGELGR